MKQHSYDLVIIGAGVSGAAQFYAAAKYSTIGSVALIEKESTAGAINSAPTNNSQTLHEGDIETNHNFEKATAVKKKSSFTRTYLEKYKRDKHGGLYLKGPKMVLGVGEREVSFLKERYQSFKDLYPTLEEISHEELKVREPKIIEGRAEGEELTAHYNPDGITVNYGKLAEELIQDGQSLFAADTTRVGDVAFDTKIADIEKTDIGFRLTLTSGEVITARFVSVCAGAHSMYFAKKLKLEDIKTTSTLLVAGNFYYTPKYLNAKVYTVQNPKLPFSAVHGDPDILNEDMTRYGPTTRVVATLERHRLGTFFEYLSTVTPIFGSLGAYVRIMLDREFFFYAFKHNVLFLIPFVGNYLFVEEVKKIIPTIKYKDLKRAKGQGGVRPQIVQTAEKNPLNLGEAKLAGEQIKFNVTPSPGATTCVFNGLSDMKEISAALSSGYNEAAIEQDFGQSLS